VPEGEKDQIGIIIFQKIYCCKLLMNYLRFEIEWNSENAISR